MQPRNYWNLESVRDEDQRLRQASLMLRDLYTILNNGFVFKDNIRGAILTVSFTAANTPQLIKHGLAFTPSFYLPIQKSVAMDVYGSNENFNEFNILLSSTAIGTATIMVF